MLSTHNGTSFASRAALDLSREIADSSYDWELWFDPAGALAYTSPSCERITGYPPEDRKSVV